MTFETTHEHFVDWQWLLLALASLLVALRISRIQIVLLFACIIAENLYSWLLVQLCQWGQNDITFELILILLNICTCLYADILGTVWFVFLLLLSWYLFKCFIYWHIGLLLLGVGENIRVYNIMICFARWVFVQKLDHMFICWYTGYGGGWVR